MTDFILTEQDNGVLIVRLHRSEKKNALTTAMYTAMADAIDRRSLGGDAGSLNGRRLAGQLRPLEPALEPVKGRVEAIAPETDAHVMVIAAEHGGGLDQQPFFCS